MAGTLKPTGVKVEGTWLVNNAVAQYGTGITNLFDGIRGTWDNGNTFYWNNATQYIDITLNQKSAIWVIGNVGYPTYANPLKVEKWNGTQFVLLTNTPTRISSATTWEKMIELEKGRYKFSFLSGLRMDDEWYIENLNQNKTLIQLGNGEVKHWKDYKETAKFTFDEASGNVVDSVNPSIVGTVTGATRVTGWNGEGNALNFDGDDYVLFNNKVVPLGTKSVRFKLNIVSTVANANEYIMGTGYYGNNSFAVDIGFNSLRVYATKGNSNLYYMTAPLSSLPLNTWHDILFTFDGTVAKLYIDDMITPIASSTASSNEVAWTHNLYMGGIPNYMPYSKIKLDNLEIYDTVFNPLADELWRTITTDAPNKSVFDSFGYDDLSVIPTKAWNDLLAFNQDVKLLTYVPTGNTIKDIDVTRNGKGFNMKALPIGQVAVSNESFFSNGGVEKVILEFLNSNNKPQGNLRVAMSGDDGFTWRVFRGGIWNLIDISIDGELKSNGNTLDEANNIQPIELLALTGQSEMLLISYYIEDDIRERTSTAIDQVTLSQDAVINTPEINDMALYILNTISTIKLDLLGTSLIGEISDIDFSKVRYRVSLNGNPYYPRDGSFTPFLSSPAEFSLNIYSRDIKLGMQNNITVEYEDYWGATQIEDIPFIGEYVGLIFKDPKGDTYSTEIGEIIKYLNIGTLIAGQVSTEHEIFVHNSLGYDVVNPTIEAYTDASGVTIELSKTQVPFVAEDRLSWNQDLVTGGSLSFYIRIATKYTTPPKMGGEFSLRVFATKKD